MTILISNIPNIHDYSYVLYDDLFYSLVIFPYWTHEFTRTGIPKAKYRESEPRAYEPESEPRVESLGVESQM